MAEGRSTEEIREALEGLNVGRLRVATKGVDRASGRGSTLEAVERRLPGGPRPLHARPGRRASQPDDHDRQSAPRALDARAPMLVDQAFARESAAQRRLPTAPQAIRHRHHRHGGGAARRGDGFAILVQYAQAASMPSPKSRRTAGTGGSITTPIPRLPTRSSRSGAGFFPTSRSTRFATGCPLRACRRSSPLS